MAGRLDNQSDFTRISENNSTGRMPLKKDDASVDTEMEFDRIRPKIAISMSRKHWLVCYVFYGEKRKDGGIKKVYRRVVFARDKMIKNLPSGYVEAIDVDAVARKVFVVGKFYGIRLTKEVAKVPKNTGFKKKR